MQPQKTEDSRIRFRSSKDLETKDKQAKQFKIIEIRIKEKLFFIQTTEKEKGFYD